MWLHIKHHFYIAFTYTHILTRIVYTYILYTLIHIFVRWTVDVFLCHLPYTRVHRILSRTSHNNDVAKANAVINERKRRLRRRRWRWWRPQSRWTKKWNEILSTVISIMWLLCFNYAIRGSALKCSEKYVWVYVSVCMCAYAAQGCSRYFNKYLKQFIFYFWNFFPLCGNYWHNFTILIFFFMKKCLI